MSERVSFREDELDALTEAVCYIADGDGDEHERLLRANLSSALEKIEAAQERACSKRLEQ